MVAAGQWADAACRRAIEVEDVVGTLYNGVIIETVDIQMNHPLLSAEELTSELRAHGLQFLVGRQPAPLTRRLSSAQLLASLARQEDARLRAALIALLLANPALASAVPEALSQLGGEERMTFKLYYTAAVILEARYAERLQALSPDWCSLPDLFSQELGIPSHEKEQTRLQKLGQLHRQITGLAANWPGTYEYAASRLIRRLEREASWAA